MTRTLPRLSGELLADLWGRVRCPTYSRDIRFVGIVHVGLGAFHRAHQAVYTDDCLSNGERGWGTVGLSLRSSTVRAALAPQDGLYTVLERDSRGDRPRVIGSVFEAIAVRESPELAMCRLTHPSTRIISLTVTEKAYCREAGSDSLDETNPEIVGDLRDHRFPRTVPGLLVEALARRHVAGAPPCTVLVCDNLPNNGATVARTVGRFAECRDVELARYIAESIPFPCTMVDRIVPATTESDRARVEAYGYYDAWPVTTEPFSQWVIEDRFAAGRPRWDDAGALLVKNVAPFETLKLRLLNGAHSALAYLGAAAGIETVADAVSDRDVAAFLDRLWHDDLVPTVPPVVGVDIESYLALLMKRFENCAIRHHLQQIAMDGSQKLPQRLLAPLLERLRIGATPQFIALAVAGWIRYLQARTESGSAYPVNDPISHELQETIWAGGNDASVTTDRILSISQVFDPSIKSFLEFRSLVAEALASLLSKGVRRTLSDWVRREPSARQHGT